MLQASIIKFNKDTAFLLFSYRKPEKPVPFEKESAIDLLWEEVERSILGTSVKIKLMQMARTGCCRLAEMDQQSGIKYKVENRGAINSFIISPDVKHTSYTHLFHIKKSLN